MSDAGPGGGRQHDGTAGGRLREEIPSALDGERIDRAVALLTGLTRTETAGLVDAGAVTIDGRVVPVRGRRVRQGQVVAVELPAQADTAGVPLADATVDVPVVHADEHVIVVDKPAGLVVHPGAGVHEGTLVNGLLARFPDLEALAVGDERDRPGIVHRLDRGTSGLLVVARTPRARDLLRAALADHTVERVYAAVVVGTPEADEGLVDAPIGRSHRDPTRMAVRADGRPARTRYRVLRRFADPAPLALVECRLETGRTHQIRVHLGAIGHPVLGDERYGGARVTEIAGWRPLPGDRPWLHAGALGFDHPGSGRAVRYEAPLPEQLAEVLAMLT